MLHDRKDSRPDTHLNNLLAKQEITEVLYLYCRAMDRVDRKLANRVWHAGGLAEYPPSFKGTGEEFVEFVSRYHEANLDQHHHEISNILIVVDGDTATSESYVTAALRYRENGQVKERTVRARYLDRWAHRDGRWAIDSRVCLQDFSDVRDVIDEDVPALARRSPADPSYAMLEGL